MKHKDYRPRIIDKKVDQYLAAFGAVCIEGPKWCGKTWTSSAHCKSEIFIGDPSGNFQNRQLAELSPALVLERRPSSGRPNCSKRTIYPDRLRNPKPQGHSAQRRRQNWKTSHASYVSF